MKENVRKDVERFVKNYIEPILYVTGSLNDLENIKRIYLGDEIHMYNGKKILYTIMKVKDKTYEFKKLSDIFTVPLSFYKTNINSFFTNSSISNSIILNSIDNNLGIKTKKHYKIERNGLYYSIIFDKTFSEFIRYDIQVFDESGELILGIDNYNYSHNLNFTIKKPDWFTKHEEFRFEKFDLFTKFEPKLSTGMGKILHKLLKNLVSNQNKKDSDDVVSIYANKYFKEIVKYLYENDINLDDLNSIFVYSTMIYSFCTPEGKEVIKNITKQNIPTNLHL